MRLCANIQYTTPYSHGGTQGHASGFQTFTQLELTTPCKEVPCSRRELPAMACLADSSARLALHLQVRKISEFIIEQRLFAKQ